MDIIEEITEIIEKLNIVDGYCNSLNNELNILDEKTQDLLHYIENNKISTFHCYRIIKELKEIRQRRRKVKQDIELSKKYQEQKNRLASSEHRQFLLTELHKKEKQLQTEYKNRFYTEEDIQKILKGV